MESNKNMSDHGKTTAGSMNKPTASKSEQSNLAGAAPQRAKEIASDVSSGVQNAYDQTAKVMSEAYDKTSEVINRTGEVLTNTYDQTMTYGRENPGKLTLIAFGAGIGIGLLLATGFGGGRGNRTSRFAEPVVNALSAVALEFFR